MAAIRSKRMPIRNVTIPLYVHYAEPLWDWRLINRGGELTFAASGLVGPSKRAIDRPPWTSYMLIDLRDRFLKVQTPEDAHEFLRSCGTFTGVPRRLTWGAFQQWLRFFTSTSIGVPFVTLPALTIENKSVYEAATGVPDWKIHPDEDSATRLSGVVYCSCAVEALNALIATERLAGGEFFQCKRCRKFFAKGDTKREEFCSQSCGHRFTQKERRARERAAKANLGPI